MTQCGGLDIVHLVTEQSFAKFDTNSFAKIENLKFYIKTQPTDERFGLWLLLENLDNLVTDMGNLNCIENEKLLINKNINQISSWKSIKTF